MQKTIPFLALSLFFFGCTNKDICKFKINMDYKPDSLHVIRMVNPHTKLYHKGFFKSLYDSTMSDSAIYYCKAKFQRKFGEYDIAAVSDSASDSVRMQIVSLLKSLLIADDIRTILCGDSIISYINRKPERYFLFYVQTGAAYNTYKLVIKNIPFYFLQVATLGIIRVRWTEGHSYLIWAIYDKSLLKPIYVSYNRRLLIPWDEITINKQIEQSVTQFIKKTKLK